MTPQEQQHFETVLTSARKQHGIGETTPSIGSDLISVLASCMKNGDVIQTATTHHALATHYMISGQLDDAIQHCKDGLSLVGGTDSQLEVDFLVLYSRQILSNNVYKARELTTQAMALSTKINGHPAPSVMLRHAEAVGADGDTDAAISLLRHAEELFEIEGDDSGRLLALLRLCVQLVNSRQHGLVIEYATEAIALAEQQNRRMSQMNAFKFLAMALTASDRLPEAYEVGKRALDIAEAHYPGHLVGDCTGVLGDIYLQLNDLQTALKCFARALSVYRETGHRNGQALCMVRMGEVYGRAGQTKQAEQLLVDADAIAESIGNNVLKRTIALSRAGLYMRLGNDAEKPAKDSIDKAVEAFRRIALSTSLQQLPSLDNIDSGFLPLPPSTVKETKTLPVDNTDVQQASVTASPSIHVVTLGSFRVVRGGYEITMDEWKRKKARDVFKYLVSRHRKSVTVDDLVQNIWGEDVEPERCLPTLQNSISAIRTALEPDLKPRQNSKYLHFRDGSYLLDLGKDSIIDVDAFTTDARMALSITEPQSRLVALSNAIGMYSGDFLPDDTFSDWTDFQRQSARDLAIEVLDHLASTQFSLGLDAAARATMQRTAELTSGE